MASGPAVFVGLIVFRKNTQYWGRAARTSISALFSLIGVVLLIIGVVVYWYTHRPVPESIERQLYQGVMYYRDVRTEPRPIIIHVITIDLNTANVEFKITPPDLTQERALRAQTTSDFLDEFDLQIAINGDYYEPWWYHGPWDYYPHENDPLDVLGFASADGVVYGLEKQRHRTLFLSEDNALTFDQPDEIYNAISGNVLFIRNGQFYWNRGVYRDTLHPRSALAINEAGDMLILIVVDGRQPNYSEGVRLDELGDIAIEYGAYEALNLDGGGSSALVIEGEDGKPEVLNSPIDNYIPGRQRPVGNHLGVYVN
jgi:hypothetical protein